MDKEQIIEIGQYHNFIIYKNYFEYGGHRPLLWGDDENKTDYEREKELRQTYEYLKTLYDDIGLPGLVIPKLKIVKDKNSIIK